MHCCERMKMQIQILLQFQWCYVYFIMKQLKEEKKYAAHEDLQVSLQLTNQNLDPDMCHWTHL